MAISRNISFFAGFTVLLSGVLGFSSKSVADPAEIFAPLIENMPEKLPSGTSLRLPAYFPTSSTKLYPYFVSDDKGFRINITIKPDCQIPSCKTGVVGAVGILNETDSWPPTAEMVSLISLTPEISAYHLTWGKDEAKSHNIVWQQDGQIYGIGALDFAVSISDLVAIAKSMTNEQPIFSSR